MYKSILSIISASTITFVNATDLDTGAFIDATFNTESDTVFNLPQADPDLVDAEDLLDSVVRSPLFRDMATGSSIRQVTDLFISCERDEQYQFISAQLLRVVSSDAGDAVYLLAELDESYCTDY